VETLAFRITGKLAEEGGSESKEELEDGMDCEMGAPGIVSCRCITVDTLWLSNTA
jgi:hypothetical protein